MVNEQIAEITNDLALLMAKVGRLPAMARELQSYELIVGSLTDLEGELAALKYEYAAVIEEFEMAFPNKAKLDELWEFDTPNFNNGGEIEDYADIRGGYEPPESKY